MGGVGVWLRGLLGKREAAPGPSLSHAPMRSSRGRPQSFAEDCNDFALAMYGQLRLQPGNLFFSPFSIRTALGMAQAGVRGDTAAQMRNALCISSSDEALHVAFDESSSTQLAVSTR